MSTDLASSGAGASRLATERPVQFGGGARRIIHRLLARLEQDAIVLKEGDQVFRFGAKTPEHEATLVVQDPRFYKKILTGGSVAAGEAYFLGYWSSDDLPLLLRIFVRNLDVADAMERGWARLLVPFLKVFHALRRNTKDGSRRNIHAHYDLGNEFFEQFLDETMMYSCGIFERDDSTMHDASVAKNDRICRKLRLTPQDHVLEIGTGWGGFALHAAQHYGCRVTTTTISEEQLAYAKDRVERAGLSDRITLRLEDYRDLTGRFDKLVSIEMIEAVGHQFYPAFFETLKNRLVDNGTALIQAITIVDQRYESARRSVDFIQRYIFPGSCIPSVGALLGAMSSASDLRLVHLEDQTPHYSRTLAAWRERFWERADEIRSQGFPDTFLRMWDYYFAYCEAGFTERHIGSAQLLFARPGFRDAPLLPELDRGSA